jgi:hypothetical protein
MYLYVEVAGVLDTSKEMSPYRNGSACQKSDRACSKSDHVSNHLYPIHSTDAHDVRSGVLQEPTLFVLEKCD